MQSTNISRPDHFHRVVDCQWACPAHTPVPEYIRLIAAGRHADAYMVNWRSNVFPGILGRTCDRPCEPACRRARVEQGQTGRPAPVAICRLKRVAADMKGDIRARLPRPGARAGGPRVACVGGGPASLTVARDLATGGCRVTVFDEGVRAGGMIRTQIPRFRLPEEIIDEETGYVLDLGVDYRGGTRVDSMRALLEQGFDAIFVGCGAPRGRDLDLPGRAQTGGHAHVGIDWLASVSFGHVGSIGRRVLVLGGGNTAMDCCRTARRLGGEDVKVVVRSAFAEMKASPWEKEDAMHEGIPILDCLVPRAFLNEGGRLAGMLFEKVRSERDRDGRRRLVPTGAPMLRLDCDEVLIAIGQENAFPWIERDLGIEFDGHGMPRLDPVTLQSTLPHVLFGGDAALGPKNIIWAVAHGHEAAVSIDLLLAGRPPAQRPAPAVTLVSQKMGIHEWSYDNEVSNDTRHEVPWCDVATALRDIRLEVELGFDARDALHEARRCLNCDVQTVFEAPQCIECDACVDVCPMDCITFTDDADEPALRAKLRAPALNPAQPLYVAHGLRTGRIMVKDEDVCLHCGLCAERCPTGAWDMRKFLLEPAHAGSRCSAPRRMAAR